MIEFGAEVGSRLEALRQSPPINLDNVDFTINDPSVLRRVWGRTFTYFNRVETEVHNNVQEIKTLIPSALKGQGEEFLDIWEAQEDAHGKLFGRLQTELGLPAFELPQYQPNLKFQAIGFLAKQIPAFEDILYKIYVTRGAMHERLTAEGYAHLIRNLRSLGEVALAKTMIQPIQNQEARHLNYYIAASKDVTEHLSPWQGLFARLLSVYTYSPVGAYTKQAKADFGHSAHTLVGDKVEFFARGIQSLANDLLVVGEGQLKPFVIKAIKNSVQLAREQGLIAASN